MAQITWGDPGTRKFSTGVDRGVLFVQGRSGVPWNGLVSVTARSSGGTAVPYYIDGIKYLNFSEREEFEGSIEAFYSPPEFDECDGIAHIRPGVFAHHQVRKPFDFAYRSTVGNDLAGVDHGYKLHLIYNALASPSELNSQTISDSVEPDTLSWDISSTPVEVPGHQSTSFLTLDSTVHQGLVSLIERILYGKDTSPARMPTPAEILDLVFAEYGLSTYGTAEYF